MTIRKRKEKEQRRNQNKKYENRNKIIILFLFIFIFIIWSSLFLAGPNPPFSSPFSFWHSFYLTKEKANRKMGKRRKGNPRLTVNKKKLKETNKNIKEIDSIYFLFLLIYSWFLCRGPSNLPLPFFLFYFSLDKFRKEK